MAKQDSGEDRKASALNTITNGRCYKKRDQGKTPENLLASKA
jgi:hypothetical protein